MSIISHGKRAAENQMFCASVVRASDNASWADPLSVKTRRWLFDSDIYRYKKSLFFDKMTRVRPNILVTGTPGTGKTSMCQQLAVRCALQPLYGNLYQWLSHLVTLFWRPTIASNAWNSCRNVRNSFRIWTSATWYIFFCRKFSIRQ